MSKRYPKTVTPTERRGAQETRRLFRLLREKQLMSITFDRAQHCIFADRRDRRIHDGVRAIQYKQIIMQHAWNITGVECVWPFSDNPINLIRMPKNNLPGGHRLKGGEFKRLSVAAEKARSRYLELVVVLAIGSAIRRGEILGLRWEHIDLGRKVAFLSLAKNGSSRLVTMSDVKVDKLKGVRRTKNQLFRSYNW